MNFGKVLTISWKIIRRYKTLLIFGLIVNCGSHLGILFFGNGSGRGMSYQSAGAEFTYAENLDDIYALMVSLLVFLLLLLVVTVLCVALGQVGLIKGALLAEAGAKTLAFGETFEESKPFFWRRIGLFLLGSLAGIVIVFGVGTFIAAGVICVKPIFWLLIIPLLVYLMIVIKQANIVLVAENLGVLAALDRGWNFTKENLGSMIVMGIILLVCGTLVGYVIGLPWALSTYPGLIYWFTIDYFTNIVISTTEVLGLLYLPISLALSTVLFTYIEVAWVLTYLENMGGDNLRDKETSQLSKLSEV